MKQGRNPLSEAAGVALEAESGGNNIGTVRGVVDHLLTAWDP